MKLTPKTVFIILVTAAILISLLVFGWNELQTHPIDVIMYGAEIKADGTVIRETEFRLQGYLKKYHSGGDLTPYLFYLEPITFRGILGPNLAMYDTESVLHLTGDVVSPNYYGFWFTYSVRQNAPVGVSLYLRHDLQYCVIETEGRYFVGSVRKTDTVQSILDQFPEVKLE